MFEDIFILGLSAYLVGLFGLPRTLLALTALSVVTYIGYIKVMFIYRKKKADELKWYHWVIGIPMAIVFLPLDVLVNTILGTLIFLELPKEWLFTQRLDRHGKNGSKFAIWVCKYLLNPFDEDHCYDGTSEDKS